MTATGGSGPIVATRSFTSDDQARFARLSGDRNPMHVHALAARRTQAGAPVVHGIHVLLWALDRIATDDPAAADWSTLKVKFGKFVFLDQAVTLRVARRSPTQLRLEVVRGELLLATFAIGLGARPSVPAPERPEGSPAPATEIGAPDLAAMGAMSGWLASPVADTDFEANFPALSASVGAAQVAAMAQLSTLVGMVCPGLHSIFSDLNLQRAGPDASTPGLVWRTTAADERFRIVSMAVGGPGFAGEVTAVVRQEPVAPPSLAALAGRVGADEFAGITALVVGGSRGLGAATALLLAAGGARIVVTYLHGRAEAEALQAEIHRMRGTEACRILHLDATGDVQATLNGHGRFDQIYYFATTQIFRQKSETFDPALLADFTRVYLEGFHAVLQAARATGGGRRMTVFYPSSVAVAERPRGMTEYAMAKAAGELLCIDLAQADPSLAIVVHRIPRTTTDQTATSSAVEAADPAEVMLPQIRRMVDAG